MTKIFCDRCGKVSSDEKGYSEAVVLSLMNNLASESGRFELCQDCGKEVKDIIGKFVESE
jgi:hypothetical protein